MFLPEGLGSLGLSSRERSLSGHLVETQGLEFAIHLQVDLSDFEGERLMGTLSDVDRVEILVINMEGDVEVVDAQYKS